MTSRGWRSAETSFHSPPTSEPVIIIIIMSMMMRAKIMMIVMFIYDVYDDEDNDDQISLRWNDDVILMKTKNLMIFIVIMVLPLP